MEMTAFLCRLFDNSINFISFEGNSPNDQQMKKIAIFASGNGTNAERITRYFKDHTGIQVRIILSNREDAFVLERAKKLGIETRVFNRQELAEPQAIARELNDRNIDLVVLAGFLWLIPKSFIEAFRGRIINIHPALLPDYGGKNMYGNRVHEAVIAAGEKQSGITIHVVDEIYDHGKIIFQARCDIREGDTAEKLAEKIHQLEYDHFPVVIEKMLTVGD